MVPTLTFHSEISCSPSILNHLHFTRRNFPALLIELISIISKVSLSLEKTSRRQIISKEPLITTQKSDEDQNLFILSHLRDNLNALHLLHSGRALSQDAYRQESEAGNNTNSDSASSQVFKLEVFKSEI